jgi:hypothetical protein
MQKSLRLIGIVLFAMCGSKCTNTINTTNGILGLTTTLGKKIYFKREIRGRNFDEIALSGNGDLCSKPTPQRDFIFPESSPTIFFKFEGETLHLYLSALAQEPRESSIKINIMQHFLTNPEYIQMLEEHSKYGLTVLDVPIVGKCESERNAN